MVLYSLELSLFPEGDTSTYLTIKVRFW